MKFNEMQYTRPDIEQVKQKFADLTKRMENATSGEEQWQIHQEYYELNDHVMTQAVIAEIRHDVDMTDEFYEKENDFWNDTNPILANISVEYKKQLLHSKFRPYLEEKIGKVAFKNMELAECWCDHY